MPNRSAVFIDLHGTLGDAAGDPWAPFPGFDFYPFATEAIRTLNGAGLLVLAITNQSPIARGRFTIDEFWARWRTLEEQLVKAGVRVAAVYCCPHDENDGCNCIKPRTGFVEQAVKDFDIDPRASFVVGDRGSSDILLAVAIGAKGILVRTGDGEGSLGQYRHLWEGVDADYIATDALDAARWIAAQVSRRNFE
jgi:D-glycero-D-manno-heptose 1,7-bisphosphate phosphatase